MKIICEKSVSGKVWVLDDTPNSNSVIDSLLIKRGISTDEEKHIFLNPSLYEQMPDPLVLKGMDSAVKIAAESIRLKKKIAIFGDYDVDGITAAAILIKYFRIFGADIIWHLPDREVEGYGLNIETIQDFKNQNAKLIITVDCGITAVSEIASARKMGLSVIVTDHHAPDEIIPDADAVVNPKQPGDESSLSYLAGVGVAFMFLVALNRELGRPVQDMIQFMDLVALGTICDSMPLIGLNRAIANSGLKVLEQRKNVGLRALMEVAKVKKADVYAAGFILGPRLNAAGRIIDANIALNLILTENPIAANELAEKLNEMNAKRQAIQNKIMMEADDCAKAQKDAGAFCLFIVGENWHGGVMGIIAGRLREKYAIPCCVATKVGNIINGSGRGIETVDLGKIIQKALSVGIISKGGGHAAAAGFELDTENEKKFADFMNSEVSTMLSGKIPPQTIKADIEIDAGGANFDLVKNLESLGPFGVGNPEPVLCLSGGIWTFGRRMGNGGVHFFGNIKTSAGNLAVVAFNMSDGSIGRFLLDESKFNSRIKVIGKLKENDYTGGVQLFLEDLSF